MYICIGNIIMYSESPYLRIIYIYIILHRNPERKLYIYMGSYYENSLFTTIQNVIKYKK